jgi:hypothetical protein
MPVEKTRTKVIVQWGDVEKGLATPDTASRTFHLYPFPEKEADSSWLNDYWSQAFTSFGDFNSDRLVELFAELGRRNRIDDVLYVTGHCSAGSEYLVNGKGNKRISYSELVQKYFVRLLPPDWPGVLKIYACNSGSPRSTCTALSLLSTNTLPFAQLFANEMVKAGFTKCSYYGYTKTVTVQYYSKISKAVGGFYPHKYGTEGEDGNLTMLKRASEYRVKITPVTS